MGPVSARDSNNLIKLPYTENMMGLSMMVMSHSIRLRDSSLEEILWLALK